MTFGKTPQQQQPRTTPVVETPPPMTIKSTRSGVNIKPMIIGQQGKKGCKSCGT